MINKNVKKFPLAHFIAIFLLINYCNDGFFCLTINAKEVSQIVPSNDKTTLTQPRTTDNNKNTLPTLAPSLSTSSQTESNLSLTSDTSTPVQINSSAIISSDTQSKPAVSVTENSNTPNSSSSNSSSSNSSSSNSSSSNSSSSNSSSSNSSSSNSSVSNSVPSSTIIQSVPTLTAMEHLWGRFAPSSWRRLQTTVWTISAGHRIGNVSETKTILESVDDKSVTLQEIITAGTNAEIIGVKPVKKHYDFYNVALGEGMKISNASPMKIVIGGRIIPCERRIYEQTTPTITRKITVWYSTQIYPYVMRIERTVKSVPTAAEPEVKILSQSTFEVTDSSAFKLLTSKQGVYRTRTIKRNGDITTVTDSYCSLHVPGGTIKEVTHEFDGLGTEIRQIETRLLNYYYVSVPPAIIVPSRTVIPNQPLIIQYEPVRPRWLRSYKLRAVPYHYYQD